MVSLVGETLALLKYAYCTTLSRLGAHTVTVLKLSALG
jgi:hypothetical protein